MAGACPCHNVNNNISNKETFHAKPVIVEDSYVVAVNMGVYDLVWSISIPYLAS
jgi:hypothetical protein